LPSDGCRRMDQEIRYGPKGEIEVLLTAGAWDTAPVGRSPVEKLDISALDETLGSREAEGLLRTNR